MKLTKMMLLAALVAISQFACDLSVLAQYAGGASTPFADSPRVAHTSDALIASFQYALGTTNKLSDVIVAKVKPVLDDMIRKQTDLLNDATVAQTDRATKRVSIVTVASDAIKAIVTPAQFAIVQPMLQALGGGGRAGRTGTGALLLRRQAINPERFQSHRDGFGRPFFHARPVTFGRDRRRDSYRDVPKRAADQQISIEQSL